MAAGPVSRIRQAELQTDKLFEISLRDVSMMSTLAVMAGFASHRRHDRDLLRGGGLASFTNPSLGHFKRSHAWGALQEDSKSSGQELHSIGFTLFLRKIDHDDLRVFAQAVEDDLFAVACDIEGPHSGAVL